MARRAGRVVVVAGADLAHVGPRFGDPKPLALRERDDLARADKASLACAIARDGAAFWADVARDLDTRRVCGLAPIYALLETLDGGSRRTGADASLLHYEQTVDPEEGSIVSHAAVAYYG